MTNINTCPIQIALTLSLLLQASAGEKEGYETKEERRVRIARILADESQKERKRVSNAFIRIAKMIIAPNSSPEKCTLETISFLRKTYQELSSKQKFLNYRDDGGVDELAMALYSFKGRTEAMYEFTKLSGTIVTKLHQHSQEPNLGEEPQAP